MRQIELITENVIFNIILDMILIPLCVVGIVAFVIPLIVSPIKDVIDLYKEGKYVDAILTLVLGVPLFAGIGLGILGMIVILTIGLLDYWM